MKIKVIVSLFISLRAVWADVAIHQDSEQLVFQEVDHPDSSEAISPRRALGHDFDDEKFLQEYKCDKNHGYRLKILHREPFIMVVDDFLAPGEAEHFILAGLPDLKRSEVQSEDPTVNGEVSTVRTSYTSFMTRSQDEVFECVQNRVSSLVSLPADNIESFQLVWYRTGQQYKAHHDWFDFSKEESFKYEERGGQRLITMFVYLNDLNDDQGGSTSFPHLNLSVTPKKNRAAFWFNINANGGESDETLHSGDPVKYGQKWGLNVWICEHETD